MSNAIGSSQGSVFIFSNKFYFRYLKYSIWQIFATGFVINFQKQKGNWHSNAEEILKIYYYNFR